MDNTAKRRVVYFLLLSCLIHLVLLYSLSRIHFQPPEAQEDQPLIVELLDPTETKPDKTAKTKRFDAMEVKEALSEIPASLSKKREDSLMNEQTTPSQKPAPPEKKPVQEKTVAEKPSQPPPEPQPHRDWKQPLEKKTAKKERKPTKIVRRAPEKPTRDMVIEKRITARPRELPSVKDLIPSINDIWAMKAPGGSLYEHSTIVQDGIGERQAKVAFDEYLAEFKSRVKMNWKVFDDPYMHESTTVLLIIINNDGSLQSVKKIKSSGMPGHDTETLFAVRHSFPMRPPPEILLDEEDRLTIHFSFHFLVRNTAGSDQRGRPGLGRQGTRQQDPGCVPPCYRW